MSCDSGFGALLGLGLAWGLMGHGGYSRVEMPSHLDVTLRDPAAEARAYQRSLRRRRARDMREARVWYEGGQGRDPSPEFLKKIDGD